MRVSLTTALGYVSGLSAGLAWNRSTWGTAGLTASAGIAGWIEFYLLRSALNGRIGKTGLAMGFVAKLWAAALLAGGVSFTIKYFVAGLQHRVAAALILAPYPPIYFGLASLFGIEEARRLLRRFTRKR